MGKNLRNYYYIILLIIIYLFHNVHSQDTRSVILIAGNFSIDGEILNIAQYELDTNRWSKRFKSDLYIYGEYNGVIWNVDIDLQKKSSYDNLYVAGTFDTEKKSSQIQLCSVSRYDGITFTKVGEGLCPRKEDSGTKMEIYTTAIGNNGDLFVGGSFESRVWDGDLFVNVFHIARFDANLTSWFPLSIGQLQCIGNPSNAAKVNSLAWDNENEILYVGGLFDAINYKFITSGLLIWNKSKGLLPFPGGGVGNQNDGPSEAFVKSIAYESKTESLFVSGSFHYIGSVPCIGVAVWQRSTNAWRCLYSEANGISTVTSMLLSNNALYLAGWTSVSSSWEGRSLQLPYAIARLNLVEYLLENYFKMNTTINGNSNSSHQLLLIQPDERSYSRDNRKLLRRRTTISSSINRKSYQEDIKNKIINHTQSRQLNQTKYYNQLSQSKRITNNSNYNNSNSNKHHKIQSKRYKRILASSYPHPTISPGNNPTISPTMNPSPKPEWTLHWDWLPGFSGTNGPIFRMTQGKNVLSDYILIAGSFDNYPSLILWKPVIIRYNTTTISAGNVTMIPGNYYITGLITSVVQANLPYEILMPTPGKEPIWNPIYKRDSLFFILVGCVAIGIVMGLGFAVGFFSRRGYITIPNSLDTDFKGNSSDSDFLGGISLVTLTGASITSASVTQFRECFVRAMHSRHLPTHETLLIINPKEIVLSKIIGEGSFGRVWSGQWRNNVVAVKEFVFAQAAIVGGSLERNNIIEEIVGEAGIMACLRHPKILQLYGCSLTMQAIWIVSELCIRGSLRMVLMNQSMDLTMAKKLAICMDVADGMHYLHTRSPPVIHRDLKSHNIFITEPSPGHLVAKIGDWGSARAIALTGAKSMTQGVGTACWLSPEVINNAHFSKSSDVYAFGIILWEVFTRQEIYEGLSAAQIIAKVAHEGLRPNIPFDCPWADIMQCCWKQDAMDRPTFHQILVKLSKMYTLATKNNNNNNNSNDLLYKNSSSSASKDHNDLPQRCALPPKVTIQQQMYNEYLGLMENSYQNPSLYSIDDEIIVKKSISDPNIINLSPPTYVTKNDGSISPQSSNNNIPTPPVFPLANFDFRKYKSNDGVISKRSSDVTVPEQLNFDVSDLTGPSFFIVDNNTTEDDDDDNDVSNNNNNQETTSLLKGKVDYLFEDHRIKNNNNNDSITYANDKALNLSPRKTKNK